ncbi:MAG TPA: hypothetical protein VE135_10870 [Pyrinomonadaceae bacterium]|nr:hypothetical protein [Pyrinomonadaceae bacterium]
MPKSFLSVLLALALCVSFVPLTFAQEGFISLTNADILTMVRAKLSPTLIVEKINTSSCNFDTFPSVLAELKDRGVPDEVLMAMVQAPHGIRKAMVTARNRSQATEVNDAPSVVTAITVPDGTALEVEVAYTVSSADVEEGTPISFNVVQPIKINGVIVIARGARATARVTKAKKGGSWGRAGQLAWTMQDVIAVDGSRIPLQFGKSTKGDSKGGTVATAMVVTGLIFLPAAPLWGFKKGKDAKVPAGRRFDVMVHGDTVVNVTTTQSEDAVRQ